MRVNLRRMVCVCVQLRRLAETARRRLSTDIHSAVWQGDVMLVDEFLKVSRHTQPHRDCTVWSDQGLCCAVPSVPLTRVSLVCDVRRTRCW